MMYGQMTAGSWIYIGVAGHRAGHLRDLRRAGAPALWRLAESRQAGSSPPGSAAWAARSRSPRPWPAPRALRSSAGLRDRLPRCAPDMSICAGDSSTRRLPSSTTPAGRKGQADLGGAAEATRPMYCPNWCDAGRGMRPDVRHRPDLGARSRQRLPAEGLEPCGAMGRTSASASPRSRSPEGRARLDGEHVRAMLSDFHACWHADGRLRQQHPAGGAFDAGVARLRFSRLRAGLYPPAVLPGHRPVPLGRAVRRPGRHLPHRRQGEGAAARRYGACSTTGSTWRAKRIQFQGLPARICWVGLGDRHRARSRLQRRWWRAAS